VPIERADALALDVADPLAGFRDRFVEPEPGLIYLDGNSLGRLPRTTRDRLVEVIEAEWGGGLVRSWEHWIELPTRVGDLIGTALLGADPGQVVVGDATTVNLYKLAAAALDLRPERTVLVTAADEFPTDRYVLDGLAHARGGQVRVVPANRARGPATADVIAALDDDVALLCLSHVGYRSGALADLPTLTAAAHAVGALVLWDLSHAVGAVPVGLDAAGVDLATGCTYKDLTGGPGAPAFLYVNRALHGRARQPIWGWFGQRDQFVMAPGYDPESDVRAFATGTPAVLGLIGAQEGARLLAEAGLDRLRAKGIALTDLGIALADEWLAPLGIELASPRDSARRGSHQTLDHPEAWPICAMLLDEGIIGDFRGPDGLRLGPAPLSTRYVELWDAMARIRDLVAAGEHRRRVTPDRRVT
jgi:kynureninase